MSNEPHELPESHPHLRTVAMPRDANPFGRHLRRLDRFADGQPRGLGDRSSESASGHSQSSSAAS
jgi:hypothetical protein